MVKVEGGGEGEVRTDTWERGASHLVAGASERLGRRRDRSVDDRHEDVEERHGSEHLARDVEALGVLLDDEDQGADHEQNGQNLQDVAKHVARISIRLHFVPVGAGADVFAMALVVACAPSRETGAGAGCADRRVQQGRVIDGCRAIDVVSALFTSSPKRYAAVVPLQNAAGCLMPRDCQAKPMQRKMTIRSAYRTVPIIAPMWRVQQQPQHLR